MSELTTRAVSPVMLCIGRDGKKACIPLAAKKSSRKEGRKMNAKPVNAATRKTFLRDICGLIEQTRSAVAITVNAGLTMLYWHIGQRINAEILKGKRAGYGDEIVAALGRQLTEEYGPGFKEKSLRRML